MKSSTVTQGAMFSGVSQIDSTSEKENSVIRTSNPISCGYSSGNSLKECNDNWQPQNLLDAGIHRSHSSLSQHSACSIRTSPPLKSLAKAVDSYHSLPLSMLEVTWSIVWTLLSSWCSIFNDVSSINSTAIVPVFRKFVQMAITASLICGFQCFVSKLRLILQVESAWQSILEHAFRIIFLRHQTGYQKKWSSAFQIYFVNLQTHLWWITIVHYPLFHTHPHRMCFLLKVKVISGVQGVGSFHPSIHTLITLSALGSLRNSMDHIAHWQRWKKFAEMIRS